MVHPDMALLETLISVAEAQLGSALSASDSIDAKAMAVLGANVALGAAEIAAQPLLGSHWWVGLPGLAVSSVLCIFATAERAYEIGPDPADFYLRYGAVDEDYAQRQLLADLGAALSSTFQAVLTKARIFEFALPILGVTMAYSALICTRWR
jgi:hypothetical protein